MELFSVAKGCGNRSNSHDTLPPPPPPPPTLPSSIPRVYMERKGEGKVERDGINERGMKRESDKVVEGRVDRNE